MSNEASDDFSPSRRQQQRRKSFRVPRNLNESLQDIATPSFRDVLRAQRRASVVSRGNLLGRSQQQVFLDEDYDNLDEENPAGGEFDEENHLPSTSNTFAQEEDSSFTHEHAGSTANAEDVVRDAWQVMVQEIEDELLDGLDEDGHAKHDHKIHWYAPPVQRQRWGEEQVLPHINWGDLFFDLFYVAAAYNLGIMLISALNKDDWLRGLIYFVGIFGPLYITWESDTYYSSRYTVVDLSHRLYSMIRSLVVAVAVLHITPLNLLADVENSVETLFITVAILVESLLHLGANLELLYLGQGDREAIRNHTSDKIRKRLLPTCLVYLAAVACAGYFYFGSNSSEESENKYSYDDSRMLAAAKAVVKSRKIWQTSDLPFTLTAIGYVSTVLHTTIKKLRVTDSQHGDIRQHFVPYNVDFLIHRYGEWIMLMIGESVLSLLIVDTTESKDYYLIASFGSMTVIILQALKFQSEPSHATAHALWRNMRNSACYSLLIQILSIGLIAFGVSYKIFLSGIVSEKGGSYSRKLAETPSVSNETSTIVFCSSLSLVLVSLECMSLTHEGLRKNYRLLFRDEVGNIHFPLLSLTVCKLAVFAFLICLPFWNTSPTSDTIVGLFVVSAVSATRILGWAFLNYESEMKKAACKFTAKVPMAKKVLCSRKKESEKSYIRSTSRWVSESDSAGTSVEDVYDDMFDAVVVSDLKGNIVKVNRTAVAIFGYSEQSEMIGKNVNILVGGDFHEKHDAYIRDFAAKPGNTASTKLGMQRLVYGQKKNGEEIPCVIGVKRSAKGHYIIAYIRDMSGIDLDKMRKNQQNFS